MHPQWFKILNKTTQFYEQHLLTVLSKVNLSQKIREILRLYLKNWVNFLTNSTYHIIPHINHITHITPHHIIQHTTSHATSHTSHHITSHYTTHHTTCIYTKHHTPPTHIHTSHYTLHHTTSHCTTRHGTQHSGASLVHILYNPFFHSSILTIV